ncbi:MAG TPA: FxSxx-COOH system tetratricopeptide repeat protein [Pseudonocardiaceae bacterium]|nr:FxSxx-COOH system tetratricopeptide repeat protein [Pseudonocardiaceae bacterium]
MSDPPTSRQVTPTAAAESVLLQSSVADDPPDPSLRSAELSARELADALWLGLAIAGGDRPVVTVRTKPSTEQSPEPVAPKPPPSGQGTREATGKGRPAAESPPREVRESWGLGTRRSVRPSGAEPDSPDVTGSMAWPTAPALPDALLIARALRPLAVAADSPWDKVLDEEETASTAADTGMWLPRWRPEQWRRFEVALVVDTSLSMEIWQHTVREFRDVLVRQGAFRDVRTYRMDCSISTVEKLVLRTEGGVARGWRDLLDPSRRRLVLVMTDTVGAAWHTGAAAGLLVAWGRAMPVAVVQAMPERLWHWGGLAPRRMCVSAAEPGAPNQRLRVSAPRPVLGPVPTPAPEDVVIPILALEPAALGAWARLFAVAGAGLVTLTAVFMSPRVDDTEAAREPAPAVTARERVRRFRAFASVDAFHLAGLLAVAPLSLATISLVQRVLLPGAGLDTQAEVLLGGLLERSPTDPAGISYDFSDGVREELLGGLFRSDVVRVARLVSDYLGAKFPLLLNFRKALEDPDGTELPASEPINGPMIKLQAAVFRALSGPYYRRSELLGRQLASLSRFADRITRTGGGTGPDGTGTDVDHHNDHDQQGSPVGKRGRPAENQPEDASLPNTDIQSPPTADPVAPPGGTDMSAPGRTAPGYPRPVDITSAVRQPHVWGELMPLRNPDFVGREDLLERIHQRLAEPGTTAVVPEALHGLGGVGKSQTVVEYIYQNIQEYDLVWWISAEHPTQIRNSFVELARKLELPVSGGPEGARAAVLEALRRGEPYSRWILVFDNADRPEIIRDFLPRTTGRTGHIVVTSRNAQWGNVARTVEIDLFSRQESTELLRRRGGDISDVDADRLAEALGDLPLAIEQAATWRAQTGMPVPEYLELLENNRTELLQIGGPGEYQSPVAAAWNVPLSQLRTEHPAALALLEICAFFGPEPISRRLFSGVPQAQAAVPDALRDALSDPIKLNSALREINRYSLAKIDHRNNTLQLHRLVQAVLKNEVPPENHDEMRHIAHVLLVNGDPNDPDNTTTWARYAELLPHAISSGAVLCQASWVRGLLINLVRYLMNIDDYESGRELSGQAWETWRNTVGERDLQTLTMARHYGFILRRQLKFDEAREINLQTFELMRDEYGEDHEALLIVADAVALDLRGEGKFTEELEMRQDTYDRACSMLGESDPQTLTYGGSLASALRQIGQYFAARDLDEAIYRRRLITHGPDHQRTFQSLDAIAMDLRECGHYVEACAMCEESFPKEMEILGADHLRVIGALRNLGVARRKAGQVEKALESSTETYERYGRRQGDLHLDTITALMCMAVDLRQLGDLAKARDHGERARRQFQQVYGENHPYVHIASTNLSAALRLQGDVDGARALNEAALQFYTRRFGADHPNSLVMATNLASDLAALGEATRAHELDVDTLERSTRVLGEHHPSTLAIRLNLSLDLTSLGRTTEAAETHESAIAGLRERLGADHPATLAGMQRARANCDTDTMQL